MKYVYKIFIHDHTHMELGHMREHECIYSSVELAEKSINNLIHAEFDNHTTPEVLIPVSIDKKICENELPRYSVAYLWLSKGEPVDIEHGERFHRDYMLRKIPFDADV